MAQLPETASAAPVSIARLLDLFGPAEVDDLSQLAERIISDDSNSSASARQLLFSVGEQTSLLAHLLRARRTDRQVLAGLVADNLLWACGLLLPCWSRADPFRTELAAVLAPEAKRASEQVTKLLASGWLDPETERWLSSLDAPKAAWRAWREYRSDWQAVNLLDRLLALNEQLIEYPPSCEQHWISAWLDREISDYSACLDRLARGQAITDEEDQRLFWGPERVGVGVNMLAALHSGPRLQQDLQAVTAAHRRALDEPSVATIPAFMVPDLDYLAAIHVYRWTRPTVSGRTRAMACWKQLILIGPDEAKACLKAAHRGQLSPVIIHELLHCLPDIGEHRDLDAPGQAQDQAWTEGGQQAWAEAICTTGYDPLTGLRGGRERTIAYIGWKWAVRALADHLGQPRLDVARRLGSAAPGDAIAQVARWLVHTDHPEQLDQLSEQFGPMLIEAHARRYRRGTGSWAYQTASEILARLY